MVKREAGRSGQVEKRTVSRLGAQKMRAGPSLGHQQDGHIRQGIKMRRCKKEGAQKDSFHLLKLVRCCFTSQYMNTDLQALFLPQSEGKIPEFLGSGGQLGSIFLTLLLMPSVI